MHAPVCVPSPLDEVPDVEAIRDRLAALDVEKGLLTSLLRVAERMRKERIVLAGPPILAG